MGNGNYNRIAITTSQDKSISMKNNFIKQLAAGCMLTCAAITWAQQPSYEPDPRYICPPNGTMTKISDVDFHHNNHTFSAYIANGKVGVVDENKRVVIPVEYDDMRRLNSNYYIIRKGDKWGLITQYGEFVLPPVLKSIALGNQNKLTLTYPDGESGTLDFDLSFDSNLRRIAALLSLYEDFGKAFCLRSDSTIKKIALDEFWSSGQFHDGLMPILERNSKKLRYLTTTGEWSPISIPNIDPSFNENFAFSGGYLVLNQSTKDGKAVYRIYNTKGQVLWSQVVDLGASFCTLSDYVEGGYALMRTQTGSTYSGKAQWKYVSPTGKPLFPEVFGARTYPSAPGSIKDYIRPMCDEMVAFPDFTNANNIRWGFFDKNGKVIVRGKFAKVHDFHDGLAAVLMPEGSENANKWGFIDKTGKLVIPAIYSNEPGDFSEGFAVVTKTNGLRVYINKAGQVSSVEFTDALPFVKGTAFIHVYNGYTSEYMAIDHSFNVVNAVLPSKIFTPEMRRQIEQTAKDPNRIAGDMFFFSDYNCSQILDPRGDLYYVWSDKIMTINSITDGIAHVSYGPYGEMTDIFCDSTGKILFFLTRNEF